MLSFRFHLSPADNDNEDITAEGIDFDGSPFIVTGRVGAGVHGGALGVEWTVKHAGSYDVCYFGRLIDEFTIMGCHGVSMYDIDQSFVLKKIPAEYMLYRPSPHVLGHAFKSPSLLSLWSDVIPPRLSPPSVTEGSTTASILILDVDIGKEGAETEEAGARDVETTAAARLRTDDGVGPDSCATQDVPSDSASKSDIVLAAGTDIAASADRKSIPEALADVPTDQRSRTSNPKYRALWRYAISAILHDVRHKWWTWSYFAARRKTRKNFLNLHYVGLDRFFPREPNHNIRASQVRLACTAADAQFYESLFIHLSNTRPDS